MRKAFCVFLTAVLLISTALPAGAAVIGDFTDVNQSAWYVDAIKYVLDKGLYIGTSATEFSPDMAMTRGMFATVLARYAGAPQAFIGSGTANTAVNVRQSPSVDSALLTVAYKGDKVNITGASGDWFSVDFKGCSGYIKAEFVDADSWTVADVRAWDYFASPVVWACENGIGTLSENHEFFPEEHITRRDMCLMLYYYAIWANVELAPVREAFEFTDKADIDADALDAIMTLQRAGIINGRDNGCFDPLAGATRAEVATIFMNYFTYLETPKTELPDEPAAPDLPDAEDRPFDYVMTGNLVPESAEAEADFFQDACFIGHSLVVGMNFYTKYNGADFYAVNGMTAGEMLHNTKGRAVFNYSYEDEAGSTVSARGTVSDVLAHKSYGKVYIMLGVNEIGPEQEHISTYYDNMTAMVSMVRRLQPEAAIYLISLTPISEKKSLISDVFNRENVLSFNQVLQTVSAEQNVWYIDAFSLFCTEDGYMPGKLCADDGIHITQGCYVILRNHLRTHIAPSVNPQ